MTNPESAEGSPYLLIGGDEPIRRLAFRFYAIMAERPDAAGIRTMHADDLTVVSEQLADFLRGWMGGPRDWFLKPDRPCIMSLHRAMPIGACEASQWLTCMNQAMVDTGVPPDVASQLRAAFARLAGNMRSR
jgi:hemoglobin